MGTSSRYVVAALHNLTDLTVNLQVFIPLEICTLDSASLRRRLATSIRPYFLHLWFFFFFCKIPEIQDAVPSVKWTTRRFDASSELLPRAVGSALTFFFPTKCCFLLAWCPSLNAKQAEPSKPRVFDLSLRNHSPAHPPVFFMVYLHHLNVRHNRLSTIDAMRLINREINRTP